MTGTKSVNHVSSPSVIQNDPYYNSYCLSKGYEFHLRKNIRKKLVSAVGMVWLHLHLWLFGIGLRGEEFAGIFDSRLQVLAKKPQKGRKLAKNPIIGYP